MNATRLSVQIPVYGWSQRMGGVKPRLPTFAMFHFVLGPHS